MSVLTSILQNPQLVSQIASRFGVDPVTAANLVQQIAPAMTGGLQTQMVSQGAGADAIKAAVQDGTHQDLVDNPDSIASHDPSTSQALVGHLLGGNADSLASNVASSTGVDVGTVKQMLPMLAAIVVGSVSQQISAHGGVQGVLSSLEQNPQLTTMASGLMGSLFGKKTDAA